MRRRFTPALRLTTAALLGLAGTLAGGCAAFSSGRFGVGAAWQPYVILEGTGARLEPGMGFTVQVYRGQGLDPDSRAVLPLNAVAEFTMSWHDARDPGAPGAVWLRGRFGGELIGPARWGHYRGRWRGNWTLGAGLAGHGLISRAPGDETLGPGIWLRPGLVLWAGSRALFWTRVTLDGWIETREISLAGGVTAELGFTWRF